MATVVLVHGAFHGGWVWSRLAPLLRRAGHEVFTPTLTGSGERVHLLTRQVGLETHTTDVLNVLDHERLSDVVLVGHSYGGVVVTAAADRSDRVAKVLYFDAAAPRDGQASTGAFATGTADVLASMSAGDDWLLPPLPLDAVGVTAASDIAFEEDRRHPHPMRSLHEPLSLPRGRVNGLPRGYIIASNKDAMVRLFGVNPLTPFVERARSESFTMASIDAGHDAMVTHPEASAAAILSML